MNYTQNTSSLEAQSDEQLISAAQANSEAFAELYNKYVDKIFRYIYYHTNRDKDTAEDLTTEVFTRALKALPKFKWQGHPYSSYLYQVARTVCQDFYGHKQHINIDNVEYKLGENETLSKKSDLLILWERIKQMKPPIPEVFELRYLEDLPYEEISKIVGK
ncbi:MAG: sigma-70 family RNA polymerase sigma factor [Patescibacteria group bacterium]